VHAAVALGVGLLGLVAPHRGPEAGGRAAVVGVRVAEHDAGQPAEPGGRRGDRPDHLAQAGVEGQDAVAVADEVDVEAPLREPAAHDPHAVRDRLGLRGGEPVQRAGAEVERAREPQVGLRVLLGQQPDLAGEGQPVGEGVVALDEAVADRQLVDALELEPRARGLDALEGRARERAAHAPAHAGALALHGRAVHPQLEVRDGGEQLGEVRPHAVRRRGVDLAADELPASRGPEGDHGVDVPVGERREVALGHGSRVGGDGAHRGSLSGHL
jgi:hypothetical protein